MQPQSDYSSVAMVEEVKKATRLVADSKRVFKMHEKQRLLGYCNQSASKGGNGRDHDIYLVLK